MINGLLGKKVGMTQLMNDDGTVVPVTVIQAGPCVVVQRKTVAQDGYDAAQLGFVEFVKGKRVTRPMAGHFKKADIAPVRILREFEITGDEDVKAGDRFEVGIFATGESVHVTGTTKGPWLCRRDQEIPFFGRSGHPRIHVSSCARFNRTIRIPLSSLEGPENARSFGSTSGDGSVSRGRAGGRREESLVRPRCGSRTQWRIRDDS